MKKHFKHLVIFKSSYSQVACVTNMMAILDTSFPKNIFSSDKQILLCYSKRLEAKTAIIKSPNMEDVTLKIERCNLSHAIPAFALDCSIRPEEEILTPTWSRCCQFD